MENVKNLAVLQGNKTGAFTSNPPSFQLEPVSPLKNKVNAASGIPVSDAGNLKAISK